MSVTLNIEPLSNLYPSMQIYMKSGGYTTYGSFEAFIHSYVLSIQRVESRELNGRACLKLCIMCADMVIDE